MNKETAVNKFLDFFKPILKEENHSCGIMQPTYHPISHSLVDKCEQEDLEDYEGFQYTQYRFFLKNGQRLEFKEEDYDIYQFHLIDEDGVEHWVNNIKDIEEIAYDLYYSVNEGDI